MPPIFKQQLQKPRARKGLSNKQFTDFLLRRAEELDDEIIADLDTPHINWFKRLVLFLKLWFGYWRTAWGQSALQDGWIGHVEVGKSPPYAETSHTFDRINKVFPDLKGKWKDVIPGENLGTPCDPDKPYGCS